MNDIQDTRPGRASSATARRQDLEIEIERQKFQQAGVLRVDDSERHAKDLLALHLLYLRKLEKLTDDERECFTEYFRHMSAPAIHIDPTQLPVDLTKEILG